MIRIACSLLIIAVFGCSPEQKKEDNKTAPKESKSTEQFLDELDQKIPQLLGDFAIPGAAIAIIEEGEIVVQKGYGLANLEKGTKVDTKTGFNIGSISKTVAAWGVMKLVHEGKIDLDAPAERYLTRWQLPESEYDSDGVTVRRLLSHTAGLSLHGYPGWSPRDQLPTIEESLDGKNNGPGRVELIMEPGTQWKYSGGGFTILQLIIEEVTGQKFEDYMQTEILDPLGMHNSSYKIDDNIMAGSAFEYGLYGELIDFELFTAQAAAGLHTNIEDFSRFALASLYGHTDHQKNYPLLPSEIVQEMMVPAPSSNGGYGLGYQIRSADTLKGLSGHGGANTGWHAIFRVDPSSNDGFIVFTNGGSGYNICNLVFCEWITWKSGESPWDDCESKLSIGITLKQIIDNKGIEDIASTYLDLKKEYPNKYDFSEGQLNQLGYYYLGKGDLEEALAIFKINVDAFPYAFNAYDSYAEALLKRGNREEAVENYRYSILLNPENENGIQVLKNLEESTSDIHLKVPIEHLELLAGDYKSTFGTDKIITYEVRKGELIRTYKDMDLTTRLIPIADNEFVYLGSGVHVIFDTADSNTITLSVTGEGAFNKMN